MFLRLYDFLHRHRLLTLLTAVVLVGLMGAAVLTLSYKEDISDFLPVESNHKDALRVYRDIAGADKVFILFGAKNSSTASAESEEKNGVGTANKDSLVAAVNAFATALSERDTAGIVTDLTTGVDIDRFSATADFAYENIPYFLTDSDYAHLDSLLSQDNFVGEQLQRDHEMLLFPVGPLLSDNLQRDPLGLFTPVVSRLNTQGAALRYELYDDCIFSPDMSHAIAMLTSPYGASETEHNAELMTLLRSTADSVTTQMPSVTVHITGGPAIAVGNASQIKADSTLSITVAVVLILLLLAVTVRSVRNILLIALSIAFGWLFAMAGLALLRGNVSLIVLGISSVIIGIAVNYPLHLVTHLRHTPDVRRTLKEIAAPLVVGNVTTVGAFLALVPLKSVALRDLGIFSSLLLVGTILFVLLLLPHVVKERVGRSGTLQSADSRSGDASSPIVSHSQEGCTPCGALPPSEFFSHRARTTHYLRNVAAIVIVVLTAVLAYFSTQTRFDTDISHINYMSPEQRADMDYLQQMLPQDTATERLYVVAQGVSTDDALRRSLAVQPLLDSLTTHHTGVSHTCITNFLPPAEEQVRRLKRWEAFKQHYRQQLYRDLPREATAAGFSPEAFSDFYAILETERSPQSADFFAPLTSVALAGNLTADTASGNYAAVDFIDAPTPVADSLLTTLSAQLTSQDGDTFAFSVKSMNTAVADNLSSNFNYIGWVCGCIVFFFLWLSFGNLELAGISFVPMAVSWLWILGLMSLLGIDFNIVNIILATFIFGQGDDYTIFMTEGACYEYAYRRRMLASYKRSILLSALIMFIGMGTLILAKHPALHSLAEVTIVSMAAVVLTACILPPLIFRWIVTKNGRERRRPLYLRALTARAAYVVLGGVLRVVAAVGCIFYVAFVWSAVNRTNYRRRWQHRVACGQLRLLRLFGVSVNVPVAERFATPCVVSVCWDDGQTSNYSPLVPVLLRALSPQLLVASTLHGVELREAVQAGYSVAVEAPEANALAAALSLRVVTVNLRGVGLVMPANDLQLYRGRIRVAIESDEADTSLTHLCAADFKHYVLDRYRYRGADIYAAVKRNLRRNNCFADEVDKPSTSRDIHLADEGWGELSLLMALVHRDVEIYAHFADEDHFLVACHCGEGLPNLHVVK